MKTNLTTKQTKKIQNGKLAIYKDIDTADAREYLLKVLKIIFPKDDSHKANCISTIEYGNTFLVAVNDDSLWTNQSGNKIKLPLINLSKIMYTYNPEQFKPISMLCTEEKWNDDLKPVVEAFGLCTKEVNKWNECRIIKNNFNKQPNYIGTINWHELTQDHYSQTEFLEACGIVRADKVEDNAMVQETFKIYYNGICIFELGNFAKVIKSAELIKAEEELEQAKKRVESLKNN